MKTSATIADKAPINEDRDIQMLDAIEVDIRPK